MNEDIAAVGLAALGNKTRLRLYKLLIKAGDQGLNVSEIKSLIKVPSSTLAHHLATLTQSGLIKQERQGRAVISSANFPMMHGLLAYLADECCTGFCLTHEDEAA
ncbi:MAG: metalloregulator ArsR/SmtB family transcription factor [Alphaproteobacteria bacterium]|jgi:DNA-binding transcriptional ArsR family regulator|nr:metalloregulator ArsR/SmtB family transcription factor [Alphaproteobacteria bacterium]